MIAVVAGGRDYEDRVHVWARLDRVHEAAPIQLLVHGACYQGGADLLAEGWARSREVDYWGMPAKFRTGTLGKREGPARNIHMLATTVQWARLLYARIEVYAWPGGHGTADCVRQARKMKLPVHPCCNLHPLPESE